MGNGGFENNKQPIEMYGYVIILIISDSLFNYKNCPYSFTPVKIFTSSKPT